MPEAPGEEVIAMKLSDRAEEILEALWLASEAGLNYLEMDEGEAFPPDLAYEELQRLALIEIRERRVYFRPEGREEGKRTIRRHRLAERLLMDILNIRGTRGDEKACQFEHLLREGVDSKICTILNHPATCPHGKEIPPGDCCLEARTKGDLGVVPLTELQAEEQGEIAYIQTEDNQKLRKLMAMGVLPGTEIKMIQNFPTYVFQLGFSEFAVDSQMAREIFVRKG